jgi:phage-related protein
MSANPSSSKPLAEAELLSTTALIELFEIDATALGVPSILYFHNGLNILSASVVFNGITYQGFPISVTGYEYKVKEALPRPTLKMANVTGAVTALVLGYNDLVGAKVTRRRTFGKYLDAINFPGGISYTADNTLISADTTLITADATGSSANPYADPDAQYPPDIFYINQKTAENKLTVEFELGTSFDIDGITLPRRSMNAATCLWGYRSAECSFAADQVIAGANNGLPPTPILNWKGTYNQATVYSYGDGVQLLYPRAPRAVFVYIAGSSSSGNTPPNTNFWFQDMCGKRFSSCKMRFDPNNINATLPFGAFPGTANLPNVGT